MEHRRFFGKRMIDLLFASLGIISLFMPFFVLAIIIKIVSPGPLLFKQLRVGKNRRLFYCYKLRTMKEENDHFGDITVSGDKRISKIGAVLRHYKIDEVPQLWNILLGQMSFVGPRPDVPGYSDRLIGDANRLLMLVPGMTGPASIYFREEEELLAKQNDPKRFNDTHIFPAKVKINLAYLDSWALWKDLVYIALTVMPNICHTLGLGKKVAFDSIPELIRRPTLE